MSFVREQIQAKSAALATEGVFIGTSSWKYPGWFGQLYDESRYAYRGKFTKTRFERDCLTEYAEVFKTVCLDAAYYAHVFNSWSGTLPIQEQMALPGSRTNPELCAARFLLKPGRKYEEAVKQFEPYSETKEINPEAREAGKALIREGRKGRKKTFIYVNNRLEGNALNTIAAMLGTFPEDT